MAFHSNESKSTVTNPAHPKPALPWWTWVLPFFVANLGTWLSIWFKTDPGASLWYLPTALGIIMVYWWGPRVLLGVYLNAVVCAPLWDLPWQWSFLYALPETLEVGLSWLFFIKFARGQYWLPNLRHVGSFLLFGSLIPTFIANIYLVTQLYLLGDIPQNATWENWQVLFSTDLATQFVFVVPVLVLFTQALMERGWTEAKDDIPQLPFLPSGRNTWLDKFFLSAAFVVILVIISFFPIRDLRGVYGLLIIFIAIRYGVKMAILSSSWLGLLAFLLPIILRGNLGLSTASYQDFLTTNFDILFLCGVTLVTGRAISDFFAEIADRELVEKSLSARERHLILINMATKEILEGGNLEDVYNRLLMHLTNLVTADYASLLVWDEALQALSLAATTYPTEQPFSMLLLQSEEKSLALSILENRRVMFLDDVTQSSQLARICSFDSLRTSTRSAILAPLATHDYRFGIVALTFDTPQRFDREEISHIELTSQQITLALRSVQQERQIKTQLRVDRALVNIGRALSESEHVGTDEVLQLIVESARELMPHAEKSVIHLLDEEQKTLFAHAVSGFDEQEREFQRAGMRLGEGIAGQVISEGITINIGDIHTYPGFLPVQTNPNYRSLLVAPVQSGSHPIGTISIQSPRPHAFTNNDTEVLKALAIQAAVSLENTRLFETTQQRLKEVGALYRTSQGLAASLDADELIKDVIKLLQQNFGYYHVQIYLVEPQSRNLVVKHGSGYIGDKLVQRGHQILAGEGIVGHVAETGEPFFTNHVDEVVFFKRNHLLPDTQSEIAVPLQVAKQVVGVLDIQTTPQQRLAEGDFQLMVAVADQLSVALQKASLYTNLQTALQQEHTIRNQLVQNERLALVGRLLASVSHELNNPLQAIQNALFLLKDEEHLSPQGKQDLDVILSEAERMASLIERLRSAYRPGRIKDFRPVELNNLIEDVHMLISTHMRQKQVAFEFHPEPDLPPVSGMSDQLRQVVLNLFLNAIEAMKPGGRLTVWTRSLPQQNEVLLTVQDTGPGIASDILPQIFDAFITDKQTGTGLGLTISRDIIEQHFGRIEAENDPEGGAVFNIWIPMEEKGQA